ncbi:MAG: hypothetical protein ORN51_07040 [Akkermansiaceae bacterium]|nr:hypothetical protein [Akkermansiaceae bacterium]
MFVSDAAVQLVHLLADAATKPGHEGYRRAGDLMSELHIRSEHTLTNIITKAAILAPSVYPGSALVRNDINGYRLSDKLTVADMLQERGRLRAARTKMMRVAAALKASKNGPVTHLLGQQLTAFSQTVIEPLLETLDYLVLADNGG